MEKKGKKSTRKMGFKDTIKFLITGKKPEYIEDTHKEVDKIKETEEKKDKKKEYSHNENIKEENVFSQEEKLFSKEEEKFKRETGLSLEKAESMLVLWEKKNETEKLKKGAELILKYFPNHFSRKFLQEEKKDGMKNRDNKNKKSISSNTLQKKDKVYKKISNKKNNDKYIEIEGEQPKKKNLVKSISKNPLQVVGISFDPKEKNLPDENSIEDDERIFGAIAYVPFISIFVIAMKHDSKFALFHAWQAFTLLVFSIVIGTFGWIFSFMGMGIISHIINIFIFVMSVFAGITAMRGRYITIPMISSIAKTLSGR